MTYVYTSIERGKGGEREKVKRGRGRVRGRMVGWEEEGRGKIEGKGKKRERGRAGEREDNTVDIRL